MPTASTHTTDTRAVVWWSADGVTWALEPHRSVFALGGMRQVVTDGRTLVAIGSQAVESASYPGSSELRGAVWTSSDGSSWRVFPDPSVGSLTTGSLPVFTSIASTPLGFVATATGRNANTGLVDASVWLIRGQEAVMLSSGNDLSGSTMAAVTWTGTQLLAVGWKSGVVAADGTLPPDQAVVWRSTDGRSWFRIELSVGLGTGEMRSVAVLGRTTVAAGFDKDHNHAVVWQSTDGAQWRRTDLSGLVVDLEAPPVVQASVHGFVIVTPGSRTTVLTSPNGVDWSVVTPPRDPGATLQVRVGGATNLPDGRILFVGADASGEVGHATIPGGILLHP